MIVGLLKVLIKLTQLRSKEPKFLFENGGMSYILIFVYLVQIEGRVKVHKHPRVKNSTIGGLKESRWRGGGTQKPK